MNYLLDTHVLLWRMLNPAQLSRRAKSVFADDGARFFVPTVCLLEAQYLKEIGRVELDTGELHYAVKNDLAAEILPFDEAALLQSIRLTSNRDPFDRMILGQAMSLAMNILTKDKWMKKTAPDLVVF